MDLLNTVKWTFTDSDYDSEEEFIIALNKKQIEENNNSTWNPLEIIVENPTFDLVFRAWIEENTLAENEILLEDEDFFDDDTKSEFGLFEADIQAHFTANNGENFSISEVMYKIDLHLKTKELGDDVIFEGLGGLESDGIVPKFYLFCRSDL